MSLRRTLLSGSVYNAIRYTGVTAAACVAIAGAVPALAGAGLVPKKAISVGVGISSFDISFVDGPTATYVLGDRTNNGVDVIDTKTNTLRMIAGQGLFKGNFTPACLFANSCSGPNGVLIVGGTANASGTITGGEIWAGDAGPGNGTTPDGSSVKVLSLQTGSLITSIPTGSYTLANGTHVVGGAFRTDEMCYDPIDGLVMATNNADVPPYANFFNVSTHTRIAVIQWPQSSNGAEQCIYNPRTGLFYETLPEAAGATGPGNNSEPGAIVVVDPKAVLAVSTGATSTNPADAAAAVISSTLIPLTACDGPQGMALGPTPGMLVGCNGGPASAQSSDASVVLNDGSTGGVPLSVIAELPNQDGPDMVDFNPSSRLYTLAKSTKTVTNLVGNIGMVNAINFQAMVNIPTVATSGGAHSVASDPDSRMTYVPIGIPSAASHLCSSVGGNDATGCILALTRSITNTHDFDANTASDILWRDTSGNVGMWLMSLNTGSFQQQTGTITINQTSTLGNVPLVWSVIGQRDFMGDGFNAILWRDTSGDLAQWQMKGNLVQNVTSYSPLPTTSSVVGTGQFNADGMGDVLVEDNAGNLSIVFFNGANILSTKSVGKLPAGWVVAASDNKGAVFLRNTSTGEVGVWLIECPQSATTCSPVQAVDFGVVPLSWQIAGVGDFDGNGSSDILWRDSSNNIGIWLMETNRSAVTILSTKVLGAVPSNWNIAQTGDYNGVGKASILWTDTVGDVAAWAMNGTAITAVVNFGNVGTSWSVQSLNSE